MKDIMKVVNAARKKLLAEIKVLDAILKRAGGEAKTKRRRRKAQVETPAPEGRQSASVVTAVAKRPSPKAAGKAVRANAAKTAAPKTVSTRPKAKSVDELLED